MSLSLRGARRAALTVLSAAALVGASAPAANADITRTPLTGCTPPVVPYATLQRLAVPTVVKYPRGGQPSGSVSVSIRNTTAPDQGGSVYVGLEVYDVLTQKSVGSRFVVSETGCERVSVPLREFAPPATAPADANILLKRGRAYAVRAIGLFLGLTPEQQPTKRPDPFQFPVAVFFVV